jgi:NAD(P)-dependent dehydrogenase (short-subunit alcohol dehydrogenase family)
MLGPMTIGVSRLAVITGAGRGIGRRIAERLAAERWLVALVDQVYPAETLESILGKGGEAAAFRCDVSAEEDVVQLAAAVREHLGDVDALVNNAGISLIAPAEETTAAQWRKVLEVNLTGPFLLCRAFSEPMLRRRQGAIVNVASICGLRGIPDRVAYNASKHGLIGLTRTLAVEWGGRGVRANAVCPSWVATEMDVADKAGGAYTDTDITDRVPLARFASPNDVAEAVAFLADGERSGYINGTNISVDGGWHADASWNALRISKR